MERAEDPTLPGCLVLTKKNLVLMVFGNSVVLLLLVSATVVSITVWNHLEVSSFAVVLISVAKSLVLLRRVENDVTTSNCWPRRNKRAISGARNVHLGLALVLQSRFRCWSMVSVLVPSRSSWINAMFGYEVG